jgi:phage-related tail fiber protein
MAWTATNPATIGNPTKKSDFDKLWDNADYLKTYLLPAGSVIAWPTSTVPTGYLECNGASVSRATYAALFAILSDDYGNVDGNTFNLPDYRGRFLRGWDHAAANDPDRATRTDRGDTVTGDFVGTKQADGIKAHTHPGGFSGGTTNQAGTGGATGAESTGGSTGGNETRPININVMYCIKY